MRYDGDRRLPRQQLYFEPRQALRAALKHLPRRLERGPETELLEKEFAELHGARDAIMFPHARTAFDYLLSELKISPGSDVLLTPVTHPDIVNVITRHLLRPIFVDLAPNTGNIDVDDLERKINNRTRAILVTHLCGFPSNMSRIQALCEGKRIDILEDCSQIHGGFLRDKAMGLHGRAGFFSFSSGTPLNSFYGGMVITDDQEFADRLRADALAAPPPPSRSEFLRLLARDNILHFASAPKVFDRLTYHLVSALERRNPERVEEFHRGNLTNAKEHRRHVIRRSVLPPRYFAQYSDFQAAIAREALKTLREGNERRFQLSWLLLKNLENNRIPGLPILPPHSRPTFPVFPLWVQEPQAFREYLLRAGIDTSQPQLECLSREGAFFHFRADMPEAERFVDQVVFLPMHPNLTETDVRFMVTQVSSYFAQGGR